MEGVMSHGDELAAARQFGCGGKQRHCDLWYLASVGVDSDGNKSTLKSFTSAISFCKTSRREILIDAQRPRSLWDFWSATVPIAGTPPATPGSAWGTPGRYVFRYQITTRTSASSTGSSIRSLASLVSASSLRSHSAISLPVVPSEAAWKTPALDELVLYEVNVAESLAI